jgi:cyanophycinase
VVIPTASSVPEERARTYADLFREFRPAGFEVLMIDRRSEAMDPRYMRIASQASAVMFAGGDQLRLSSILGGTPLLQVLQERYLDGCVIAGTSAGAAAIPNIMIFQNNHFQNYRRGGLEITQGLGFVGGVLFDTHFVQRNRVSRLVHAVATNPGLLGFGIEENTALVIENESLAECLGAGTVIVLDGSQSGFNTISDVENGRPFSITGLTYSVLNEGMFYDIPGRRCEIIGTPSASHAAPLPRAACEE